MKSIQRQLSSLSVLAILLLVPISCDLGAQSGVDKKTDVQADDKKTQILGDTGITHQDGTAIPSDAAADTAPVTVAKDRKIPEGCWFDPIHLDFGTFVESSRKTIKGTYQLENKSNEPQKIKNITASCKCQAVDLFIDGKKIVLERKNDPSRALKNHILVPAGAKGRVEVTFDIDNASGARVGDIRFDTTDPAMPSFVLTCEVKITQAFSIDPPIVQLGIMSPSEKKDWTVKIRSAYYKDGDWKLTKSDPVLPKGLVVTSFTRKTDKKGVYYEVKGSYGPDLDEGATGGSVLMHSDHKQHKVLVQVAAQVKQKADITPKILEFKPFDRNISQVKTVYVWPTEKSVEMTVDHVEIVKSRTGRENYTFEIIKPGEKPDGLKGMPMMANPVEPDKVWQIIIKTKPGIKGRIMRAFFKVHFKQKDLPPKSFRCIGFPKTR